MFLFDIAYFVWYKLIAFRILNDNRSFALSLFYPSNQTCGTKRSIAIEIMDNGS